MKMSKPLVSWSLGHAGEKAINKGWSDLTHREALALVSMVANGSTISGACKAFGLVDKFAVREGLSPINPTIVYRGLMSYLESPISPKPEVVDIVGTMADGLTIRQIAAMNDCAVALDAIGLSGQGWSCAKIARHLECAEKDVLWMLAGLGFTGSSLFREDRIKTLFNEMVLNGWSCTPLTRHVAIVLRRANFPSRDWGSVVVNNGFKVVDGKFGGDIVSALTKSRAVDVDPWRVIPVSIPTLEEAIETILEWGCGL